MKYHQDAWNRYLMSVIVSAHIPCNAISYLEVRWSHNALRSKLVLLSASTLCNIWWREYSLTVDANKKQLPSRNKVSLALDGWTSTNKLARMLVIVYYTDQNWALREVLLAFYKLDCNFFPYSTRQLSIIGQGSTYWSKVSHTIEGSC